MNNFASLNKLVRVLSFGNMNTGNMYQAFVGCLNLIEVPSTIPSSLTNISALFANCTKLNDKNLSNWDTKNITAMQNMFQNCSNFNQPLNKWDVRNVGNFTSMFQSCANFNSSLEGWQLGTSGVQTYTGNMFYLCSNFNQDLSSWNMSKSVDMSWMFDSSSFNNAGNSGINNWDTSKNVSFQRTFRSCPFNQPINNWNTSLVTDMSNMFQLNSNFNQPLNSWNTSNVTNMSSMFSNCSSFNQPLNSWNVRKVTSFQSMFQGASNFNSSLSGWALGADTTGATCFSMFQSASSFNQNISNWDTSKVTNMASMFRGAASFNQPIGTWNVSNVTSMNQMFNSLSPNAGPPFTQDISSWDIRKVVNMDFMFTGNTNIWGSTNYSNALIAWAALPDTNLNSQAITAFAASSTNTLVTSNNHGLVAGSRVNITGTTNYDGDYNVVSVSNVNQFVIAKTFVANDATGTMNHRRSRNVVAGFGSNKYSAGAATDARNILVNTYGWTITDGGQA